MSKVVCPYCFESFDSSDVMFRCSNMKCATAEEDKLLAAFWGTCEKVTPSFKVARLLFGRTPKSGKCPKCGTLSRLYICPNCHNQLPAHMVKEKGLIISIIGAKGSGKTNFIAVLINELKLKVDCLGNISLIASNTANGPKREVRRDGLVYYKPNNTETRYNDDFFEHVYVKSECPPPTNPYDDVRNKTPLIYKLSQGKKTFIQNKKHIYLVLYDTAGENFVDTRDIASKVKFLQQSDACIFLLDTFAIPHVSKCLTNEEKKMRFDTILSNMISFFDNMDEKSKKKHYGMPMALVFSKIDYILNNEKLFSNISIEGMSINQNSSFLDGEGVDLDDIDSVSGGIRGALHSWHEDNFINSIENHYKNVHYFGISALGNMPKNGKIINLKPYRVLDPLVWILHEIGYKLPLKKY